MNVPITSDLAGYQAFWLAVALVGAGLLIVLGVYHFYLLNKIVVLLSKILVALKGRS